MTSTSMQVRICSAVAAFAAVATMLFTTATLFSAPIATGVVMQLSPVVVSPDAAPAQVARNASAASTARN